MRRRTRSLWLALVSVGLFVASCNTGPDRPFPENLAPRVELVNIPPDSSHFTANPRVCWFGTDVDGYIIVYEHAIVPESLVSADLKDRLAIAGWAETNINEPFFGGTDLPEFCWQVIDVKKADDPSCQTIKLFADQDPEKSVSQYFFVRAMDNDSLYSSIDFRLFSRSNHFPDTDIKTIPDSSGYYDLPETTVTYRGIFFEWKGTDLIDYPPDDNIAPPLDYFYEVFGPYDSTEIPWAATGRINGARFDTSESKLVLTSQDTASGGVWVKQDFCRVCNLWRKQPQSDLTRNGYFVLKVTSRDDAYMSDPTPAYLAFRAIYPQFEHDVLVYTPALCETQEELGGIRCSRFADFVDTSMLFAFHREAFKSAGYDNVYCLYGNPDNDNFPSKLTMSQYKVVVMITDGDAAHLKTSFYESLTPYMDLGGKVWIWGTAPFGAFYTGSEAKLHSLDGGKSSVDLVPSSYFGVLAEFRGGWKASYLDQISRRKPRTNEEFIGGLALGRGEMRDFKIESLEKVKRTYITVTDTIGYVTCCVRRDSAGNCLEWANCDSFVYKGRLVHWVGAPNTNYFVRDVYSEPLWLFNSYYGDFVPDDLQYVINGLQGKVIALRFNSGTFKTAVFGFSMYMLKLEDAADIVRTMMGWFLR